GGPLGRDETPPHAEHAQSSPHPASIPGCAGGPVQLERSPEGGDAVVVPRPGEIGTAEVLKRGGQREGARSPVEELDGGPQVLRIVIPQPAGVQGGGGDGGNAGVAAAALLCVADRGISQRLVTRCQ